jgi:hypothetical protein
VILQARDGSSSSRHAQSAAAFANNRWSTATTTTKITKLYNNPERERERWEEAVASEEELVGFFVYVCVCFLGVLIAPGLALEVVV